MPSCDSWRATCLAFLAGEKTGLAKGEEAEEELEAAEAAEGSAGCVRAEELPAAADMDADSGLSELRLNQFRKRRRLDGGEGARLACDDAASDATPAILEAVGDLADECATNVRDVGTAYAGAGAGDSRGACMSKSCGDAANGCGAAGAFTAGEVD